MTEDYLKHCVACSDEVVTKNKSGIKILEEKFTPLSVWLFVNHRFEMLSGQKLTYMYGICKTITEVLY
jgi:hypothetical protein